MEDFKKTIQKRNRLLKCGVLMVIILSIVLYFVPIDPKLEHGISFQMGMLIGSAFIGIFFVYKYSRSLKDEVALKKLQINEHDERKKMIAQKTSQSALIATVAVMLLVACIMMYINQLVAFVMICAIYGILFMTFAFKIYYCKKY